MYKFSVLRCCFFTHALRLRLCRLENCKKEKERKKFKKKRLVLSKIIYMEEEGAEEATG